MKRLLFVSLLVAIGFVSRAQIASGSCKLPGTYDYVNVDYYEDGHLTVSNQSGMKITQLHIKVTYVLTASRPEIPGDVPIVGTFTPVNQNYYDIEPNKTTEIWDGVNKAGPKYERKTSNSGETVILTRHSFVVEVGNLMCR